VTDEESPVIIVGAGLSGLAVALAVALHGRRAVVLDASDKVGGAAAWSGGQVWVGANHVAAKAGIDDDLTRAEAYVRAIGEAHPELLDETALKRWLTVAPIAMRYWEEVGAITWEVIPDLADYHDDAPGALAEGRYLTGAVIDGSVLGEWLDRLLVSPYFPVGTTYADMHLKGRRAANLGTSEDNPRHGEENRIADHAGVPAFGRTMPAHQRQRSDGADPLTFGTGLVAWFLARVLRQDNIDIHLSSRVTALLRTGRGAMSGLRVRAGNEDRDIPGPVVLATSSFDWDPEAVEDLLGLGPDDFGSIAPKTIRGDGLRMARDAGAAVVRIPPTAVPMPPGWRTADGQGYANGPEYALPHAMIVDASGRRFCDDSYWVDIVRKGLAPDDPHVPFFLIWDEQHHRAYGLGSSAPGEPYPDGLVTTAPTLSGLGPALGIDGAVLAATADRFSRHARAGVDPDFGRGSVPFIARFAGDPAHEPNPLLGDVTQPPFYGMRMVYVGTAIGMSGIHIDADAHVLDPSGHRIPGLHAVGSVAAYTTMGTAYNSGFALSRGLTHAYLVGRELTAHSGSYRR
jgi:3-oxosteroid 1-dehydrogenase